MSKKNMLIALSLAGVFIFVLHNKKQSAANDYDEDAVLDENGFDISDGLDFDEL